MSYREQELGLLLKVMPEVAIQRITDAHQKCGGNTSHASVLLGVSRRTLVRYINELGLRPVIEKMRGEARAA